jgi:ketosteroid isomerase-like protein
MFMAAKDIISKFYDAFNKRKIAGTLATLDPEVDWNVKGGRSEVGRDAVRDYFEDYWAKDDPTFQPMKFSTDAAGRTVVDVRVTIRGQDGQTKGSEDIRHAFEISDELIVSMSIIKPK